MIVMRYLFLSTLLTTGLFTLAACTESTDSSISKNDPDTNRWYTEQQVNNGDVIYQKHCASCHQPDGSGTTDWRQKTVDGKYPPPPLNGTAHTWHHPMDTLKRTIRMGGVPLGGSMPAFESRLNDQEIEETLAWIQSHWPDRIYNAWLERNRQASR